MKILLSQFLEQHHLSIRQAAIMTGVPRSTIGDIVTGQVCPTLATMEQLAAGLKTTISDLYESEYKWFSKSVRDSGQRTTFFLLKRLLRWKENFAKTNVRKQLHHKYFCDNMKLRKFEQMFEKRDREVHRMKYKNAVLQMLERIKSEKSWKMIYTFVKTILEQQED